MDLSNSINNLAKAEKFYFIYNPRAKARGNSNLIY